MERNALEALASLLDRLGIRWMLIGALAANRYRITTRLTQDVDLLLADTGPGLAMLERELSASGWSSGACSRPGRSCGSGTRRSAPQT